MILTPIDDRLDLAALASAIRSSSNFRFAWQFFSLHTDDLHSSSTVAASLDEIVRRPDLHSFLSDSMDDIYPRKFEINQLHRHASIVNNNGYFLDIMACASLDRLGAYSRDLSSSTSDERDVIHRVFSSIGEYTAFYTEPGKHPDCEYCKSHNNDLISNWFFDVAWDFTFLLTWPTVSLLWMGCLTDTD